MSNVIIFSLQFAKIKITNLESIQPQIFVQIYINFICKEKL